MWSQPIILTHELIFAPSFEPVTIWPRSSSICSHTYFTGSGHFHGFTRSGLIQVVSALGDCFAAVASKVSRTIQIFPETERLERVCWTLLGLNVTSTEPSFGFWHQHLEFSSGLPSKYYPGQMMLNFNVEMRTDVSNIKLSAWFRIFACLVELILISCKSTMMANDLINLDSTSSWTKPW